MADRYAKGTRREHHARKHQGLPMEDTEEWPGRTWVNILHFTFALTDSRPNSDTDTVFSATLTRASSLSSSFATPDLS